MTPKHAQNIMVRREVRHAVSMRAQYRIAPQHTTMVRLSPSTGVVEGWVDADAVDFSMGGVGLVSLVFIPRNTVATVRLLGPGDSDGVLLECPCIMRRVIMTDRRPAYHLGFSFHELDEHAQRQVQRVNELVTESEDTRA